MSSPETGLTVIITPSLFPAGNTWLTIPKLMFSRIQVPVFVPSQSERPIVWEASRIRPPPEASHSTRFATNLPDCVMSMSFIADQSVKLSGPFNILSIGRIFQSWNLVGSVSPTPEPPFCTISPGNASLSGS